MAKTKDKTEASTGGLPVDQETLTALEGEVKKGKARKFILIYKGASIKKLIVFKKGPYNTRLQKAKKDGFRGEAVCGVVTGSGVNLSFQLAGAPDVAAAMSVDGIVDKEPTKTAKLREFLADNKYKSKPTYSIVTDVQQIANADGAEADGDAASPEGAPTDGAPADSAPTDGAEAPVATHGQSDGGDGAAEAEARYKELKATLVPKVKEAVKTNPAKKGEVVPLLESAAKKEKASFWDEALEALTQLGIALGFVEDPDQEKIDAYKKELAEVNKLVAELKKHPYKSHISGELAAIKTDLGTADTEFKAKKFEDAMKALAKAKETAGKAKGFADKFAAYSKKRAEAEYNNKSYKKLLGNTDYNAKKAEITAADNLAKPPTRDYNAATTKVEAVTTGVKTALSTKLTGWFVTPNTPKIQALKTGAHKDFLANRIKAIETQFSVVKANIKDGKFNQAHPNGWKLNELIRAATEASTRRAVVDTQRPKTEAALKGIEGFKSLAEQTKKLQTRLKAADEMAKLESRQFENAVDELKKIEAEAKTLKAHGADSDAYAKDRPGVDAAYTELTKHKEAANQKPLLDGIKKKLDHAAELAKDVTQMSNANAELALAKRDTENAKQALDEGAGIGAVAGSAKDAESGKKALEALKVSIKATKKHKHAGDLKKDFAALDKLVKSAESHVKSSKKLADALTEIKQIGDDLAKIIVRLAQQEGYAADHAALAKRLKKLSGLPVAEALKPKIKPLEEGLKSAEEHNKNEAWDERSKAMVTARTAAEAAEKAVEEHKAYSAREKKLADAVGASALTNAEKTKITDLIKPATEKAKTTDFAAATKLLAKAEAAFETLQINGFAKQTPPDLAKIEAAAKRLMQAGNAKAIDKLIQRLPDNTKHEVLEKLAKERFGVQLKTDTAGSIKSSQAMLEMLAKVPDDVVGNPSIKTVEYEGWEQNAAGNWVRTGPGGYYADSDKRVVMNGRPNQSQQKFGGDIATELPSDVQENCKPKDATAVDYFDFATLHEVGHSVDDNLRFMASREGKAEFGGWKTYGGNIDPIVKAIGDWSGYNSTAEQKKALSDLILGNKVAWPTPPAGKETEWKNAKKKVTDWFKLATWDQIWWKQSDTNKIAINGTVYHRAYTKTWVSYDASARKQGITGYQFRAPGEWFAELYAAYRMDKLKPSHPAVQWLSKIKV